MIQGGHHFKGQGKRVEAGIMVGMCRSFAYRCGF